LKAGNSFRKNINTFPFEAIIWILAFVLLMMNDPGDTHTVSLCPFHNLGLGFCPGCGLGTSISYAFRGNIEASINAHPLGILAIIILAHRIFILMKRYFIEINTQTKNNHG
jgi:hypothetical protein